MHIALRYLRYLYTGHSPPSPFLFKDMNSVNGFLAWTNSFLHSKIPPMKKLK